MEKVPYKEEQIHKWWDLYLGRQHCMKENTKLLSLMKRLKILKIWIAWPKAIPKIHGQKPNIDIIILTKFFVSNLEKKIKENLSCKRKKEWKQIFFLNFYSKLFLRRMVWVTNKRPRLDFKKPHGVHEVVFQWK